MRKFIAVLFFFVSSVLASQAFALLSLELTRGMSGAVPITIMPFTVQGDIPPQNVSEIISNDLRNSGRFKVFNENRGADNLVKGEVRQIGSDQYEVSFQLEDAIKGKTAEASQQSILLSQKFNVNGGQLRSVSHHISDLIYKQITGVKGIFSTRLAYVVVQRPASGATRYVLEVSDVDGYNPRPLLTSNDPIMSPDWSPDGRRIAYVSFENKRASIYLQDVLTGSRQLLSEFPGINGAPAWSPDGRKLALVLSKSGSPNIYVMDVGSRQLTQLTKDFSINTEPAWSPDGSKIVFTSNRSGNPQIFQIDLASRAISRVTYDGKYNARASFTPDGNHIAVINQQSGVFNIGILDLDVGTFRVLTNSGSDHGSPSMAPNGSMALYETVYNGRSVLGMVATDGSVQIRLPARNGEVQDPSWSPFLS